VRELREELDLIVEPDALDPFAFASHAYPDFHLLMPLYVATKFAGVMKLEPNSAQDAAWVKPTDLRKYEMPPADVVLVNRLIERSAA
jgi:8-oxo-dGTP diphosphatase